MSTFLINIVANSDFAAVLTRDTEAVAANTAALEMNTAALAENGVATGGVETSRTKLKKTTEADKSTTTLIDRIRQLDQVFIKLSGSQDTVGYNFMGLSIRIGTLVIPILVGLLGVILQLIAGLVAMAAVAGVAALALVSVGALGVAVMSHQMKNDQMNQPEGYGQGSQASIWSVLMKPIWETLDSPQLHGQVENATMFIRALFGETIPKALEAFLSHIDPGTMMVIEQLFMRWLPNAAGALTSWGSRLFNLIGESTLSRISSFMSYLAGGIESVAVWLAVGGWDQLDSVLLLLADIIATIMDLGRSALPALAGVLNTVWPFPVKYMMEAIITFLDQLSERKDAIDLLANVSLVIATALAAVMTVQIVFIILAAAFSETGLAILGIVVIIGAVYVAIGLLIEGLQFIGNAIYTVSLFIYDVIISFLEALITGVWNLLTGDDMQPTHKVKSADEYWSELTRDSYSGYWEPGQKVVAGAQGLGEAGANTLRVIFDPGFVDKKATEEANRTTGSNVSWEVANSQFSRGASA